MTPRRPGERYDVERRGPAPTMADLHPAQRVAITCGNKECPRQRTVVLWSSAEAVERLGPTCTFEQAERRLKCSACGCRGRDKWIDCRPWSIDTDDIRYGKYG